jgi:exopolysaccharide biosynthesis polyprenyl glycosylphosphotransferase
VTVTLAATRGAYSPRAHPDVFDDIRSLLGRLTVASLAVTAARSVTEGNPFSAEPLIIAWAASAVALIGVRVGMHRRELQSRRRYASLRPTLIVGAGRVGTCLARRLSMRPEFGLLPVGFLDDDPLMADGTGVPVVGTIADLDYAVERYRIEQVIITFSRATHEQLLALTERAAAHDLDIALVPRLYERTTRHVAVRHLGGLPLVDLRLAHPESLHFRVKYSLDKFGAAVALIVVSPVLMAAMVAVRLEMGRPIFFRQTRVGYDGNEFEMLKLRTMTIADSEDLPQLPPDTAPGGVEGKVDRTTEIGRLLRRLSIDELPQLINVLRGEMSLVGPRPERPEFVRRFAADVDGYARRHRVKAGITGWSQVHGLRGQTSISDRAEWDNYYIDNFSLWLDAKILLLTVAALFQSLKPSGR